MGRFTWPYRLSSIVIPAHYSIVTLSSIQYSMVRTLTWDGVFQSKLLVRVSRICAISDQRFGQILQYVYSDTISFTISESHDTPKFSDKFHPSMFAYWSVVISGYFESFWIFSLSKALTDLRMWQCTVSWKNDRFCIIISTLRRTVQRTSLFAKTNGTRKRLSFLSI